MENHDSVYILDIYGSFRKDSSYGRSIVQGCQYLNNLLSSNRSSLVCEELSSSIVDTAATIGSCHMLSEGKPNSHSLRWKPVMETRDGNQRWKPDSCCWVLAHMVVDVQGANPTVNRHYGGMAIPLVVAADSYFGHVQEMVEA